MQIENMIDEFKKEHYLKCHRCGKELDKENWASEWDNEHPEDHHYKSIVCDCGNKNWVKLDFFGSGHDKTLQEDTEPIESSVKKVQDR